MVSPYIPMLTGSDHHLLQPANQHSKRDVSKTLRSPNQNRVLFIYDMDDFWDQFLHFSQKSSGRSPAISMIFHEHHQCCAHCARQKRPRPCPTHPAARGQKPSPSRPHPASEATWHLETWEDSNDIHVTWRERERERYIYIHVYTVCDT